MRRVVVTGMGVISPVGNDLESFWNNLTKGKNGVGMITRFDTTDQIFQLLPRVQLPPMQSEKPSMQSVMDMLMPSSPAVQKLQSMRLLSQVLQTAKL